MFGNENGPSKSSQDSLSFVTNHYKMPVKTPTVLLLKDYRTPVKRLQDASQHNHSIHKFSSPMYLSCPTLELLLITCTPS